MNHAAMNQALADRAASAIDATHGKTRIGLRTSPARDVLAAWLDGTLKIKVSLVRAYCKYLEMVGRSAA